jgi:anaerobic magnesium-protoporphyrin IX monomethyl ester cyclase|tara:strand:- start:2226 stop:3677 length:1452 start_codon:yes stop_codon:yes gene_type:complete
MRILLINSPMAADDPVSGEYQEQGVFKDGRDLRRSEYYQRKELCLPPLSLLYITTPLVEAGHEVLVLDADALDLTTGEIVREAEKFKPDVIGSNMYYCNMKVVYRMTRGLKAALDVPVVLGGPQATAMPERTLDEFEAVDCLVVGWGEGAIVPLVEYLGGRGKRNDVPGLVYRHDGGVAHNPQWSLPSNLDEIPFPSREPLRELYERGYYFNILSRHPRFDTLLTSRACPFRCAFCFMPQGSTYHKHSAERVLEEIRQLVDGGVQCVQMVDDLFNLKRKRSQEIIDLVVKENIKAEFRIRSRVDLVDEELLAGFKKMGVSSISYGMESGVDRVLQQMQKKTTVDQNERACRLTKQAGMTATSSWIGGLPSETPEELDETFRFIQRIRPTTFTMGALIPLPNTPYYSDAKRDGTLVGDWSVHSEHDPYIKHEHWSSREQLDSHVYHKLSGLRRNWRYVLQSARLALWPPNVRLLKYGFRMLRSS